MDYDIYNLVPLTGDRSLIAPPNTLVVSTYIVREFEQGSVSVGMAMAVLCVLFTTTALLILNRFIDRQKGR